MLPPPEEYEITPSGLRAIIEKEGEERLLLVDCREEEEHAFCRIEGSEWVPLSRFGELAPTLLNREGSPPMVIYCHHGMRSMQATLFLREQGKANVWSMSGGIEQWSRDIDPSIPRY
ncbi:MAG: rhodanese-like domain-containing protein [Verrucomicrobiota bacterium]